MPDPIPVDTGEDWKAWRQLTEAVDELLSAGALDDEIWQHVERDIAAWRKWDADMHAPNPKPETPSASA